MIDKFDLQEIEESIRERKAAEIVAELDALDRRSARALRAVVAGTATDDDRVALAKIEHEAIALRARLAGLQQDSIIREA